MTTTSPRLGEFQLLLDIVRAVTAADTNRTVRITDHAEDITDALCLTG
jgi:hypothetical protein